MTERVENPFQDPPPAKGSTSGMPPAPETPSEPTGRASESALTKGKSRRLSVKPLLMLVLVGVVFWYGLSDMGSKPKKQTIEAQTPPLENGKQLSQVADDADKAEAARQRAAQHSDANAVTGGTPPRESPTYGDPLPGYSPSVKEAEARAEAERLEREKAEKEEARKAEILGSPIATTNITIVRDSQQTAGAQSPVADATSELRDRLKSLSDKAANPTAALDNALKLATSSLSGAGGARAGAQPISSPEARQDQFLATHAQSGPYEFVREQDSAPGNIVAEGTPIRALLRTKLNTDSPGKCTGHVESDVFDTYKYGVLLIPKGSTIDCIYDHSVQAGQERVIAAITRLKKPDGKWVNMLGAVPSEMDGSSGLEGDVNNHFAKMFLSSLAVGAASMLLDKSQQTVNVSTGYGQTQTGGTVMAQALSDVVSQLLARNRNIPPTIERDGGTEFVFLVQKDMVMTPYKRSR